MIIQIRIEANKDDMADFIKELTKKDVPQWSYHTTTSPLKGTSVNTNDYPSSVITTQAEISTKKL